MRIFKSIGIAIFLGVATLAAGIQPAMAQSNCEASQNAAVDCFVAYAVKTDLTSLRYGMNMAQFKAYGVAVSKILQTQQDYIVMAGMAFAVADAMPPTNADGTPNTAAQSAAVNSILNAEISCGLVTLPPSVTPQQAQWFSQDVVNSVNSSAGVMMSPGFLLRATDAYIVNNTSNSAVNWTQVNSQLAGMVGGLSTAGLLKLPSTVTLSNAQQFAQDLAQAIYAYKQATGKATL